MATTSSPMDVTGRPFDNADVRDGAQIRRRPRRHRRQGVPRPRHGRQRQPDRADRQFAIDPQPIHNYDPEKAKSLLKKAGLDQLKVDLSAADAAFTGAVDAALLFKACRGQGRHRHQRHPRAERQLLGQCLAEEALRAPPTGAAGRPATGCSPTAYAKGAAWNDTFWKNPRFNELLIAGPRRDRRRQARRRCMPRCSSSCMTMAA